ncbi:hypothetical protein TeGR_g9878 [Tetraparma gracilis]|uniref:Acetyl-coenzyme A transporter 1 n=1 Tax=Tetraparma gracilis TaxID=2962635 RepID=A0ABQ6MGC2_9STRA|nr:hypothetical protein TeGR_g9878 [Tetraparma gracilis]
MAPTTRSALRRLAPPASPLLPPGSAPPPAPAPDSRNYLLLLLLYTLQGIPIGLSQSVPLLLQTSLGGSSAALYSSQALFSLCSWPFSLKLLWAPLVDARPFPLLAGAGLRKSWLLPLQTTAGLLMYLCASPLSAAAGLRPPLPANVPLLTALFFGLYFLMATQDVAVDGWALTMLAAGNRANGPVCNSVGQSVGQALSYTGFVALNDAGVGGYLRGALGLGGEGGLLSLEGFMRGAGAAMLLVTGYVALFKKEEEGGGGEEEGGELDARELGIRETYRRLASTLRLKTVRTLLLLLLTYRLPTALSDNVKTLKYLDLGLPKSALAFLSPAIVLPLGIATPILASARYRGRPLAQFLAAYRLRVTLVPLLDVLSLRSLELLGPDAPLVWTLLVLSTALNTVVGSMQFNAQMSFFSTRVDRNIGGSYMTLLNTFANLGGTWPATPAFYLAGKVDYYLLQACMSALGLLWVWKLGPKVEWLAGTKEEEWKTGGAGGGGVEKGEKGGRRSRRGGKEKI